MAFVHGKGSYFSVDDASGTERNLTTYLTEVSFPRDVDIADTSVFGNTYKTGIPGLAGVTCSISGKYDSTATSGPDVVLSGLLTATSTSTIKYGPEGSSSGKVRYTGEFWCTSYQVTGSIGDVVSFTAAFTLATNALTKDTF